MYALISKDEAKPEVLRRQSDGKWIIEGVVGMNSVLVIPSIGVDLAMSEVYYRVDFSEPEPG